MGWDLGTPGADAICAGAGRNRIDGRGGNDRIYGGSGNDDITTPSGTDCVFAGSGNDTVRAGAGSDLVYGDNRTGRSRDATDTGPDGADVLHGGLANDSIDGGGGSDVIFTGGDGTARPSSSITHGGPGNDVFVSYSRYRVLAEYLYGDAGSDLLWPNPVRLTPLGNTAIGGAGNDAIILMNWLPDGAHMGDLTTTVKYPCQDSRPGQRARPVRQRRDSTGKVSSELSVKPSPELAEIQGWINVAHGGFPSDMCICDPKIPGWAATLGDTVYS